jgi:hypothetical protein
MKRTGLENDGARVNVSGSLREVYGSVELCRSFMVYCRQRWDRYVRMLEFVIL